MPTLLEYTNDLDAIQKRFETDILMREAQIAALLSEKEKLHKGMNRKVTVLQKIISKAAEANEKAKGG